jgi:hypothetical protein
MTLIRIPSIEPETTASRGGTPVTEIVVHTTDTWGLKRYSTDLAWNMERIDRAESFGGIAAATADMLRSRYSGGRPMSDAVAFSLISDSNDRRALTHYNVASMPVPGEHECDVVENVDPALRARHVGLGGANLRSVGIENVYPGALSHGLTESEATARYAAEGWPAPYLAAGPDGVTRWYAPQHPAAYRALVDLCRGLRQRFPITTLSPHVIYYPSERIDPDPPISMEALQADVFARLSGGWIGPVVAVVSGLVVTGGSLWLLRKRWM